MAVMTNSRPGSRSRRQARRVNDATLCSPYVMRRSRLRDPILNLADCRTVLAS